MIAANSLVFWTPTDRAGNATTGRHPVRTIGNSFQIQRNSDGELVECVILNAIPQRLVPVSQLSKSRPAPAANPVSNLKSQISNPQKPAAAPAAKREAAVAKSAAAPAAKRETTSEVPEPCDILAVDFLNLLVRAFHAGAPSETHAVRSMFQTVANCVRMLNPRRVVFALDGGHKQRSELLPQYKAHRPPSPELLTAQKVLAESAIHIAGFQAIRVADWEADDVIASLATANPDTVVASCDKDLLSLTHSASRCRVYYPWGTGEFMTAEAKLGVPANKVADYLALCGDTSDGIPGAKGIGPKTAVQLLNEYGSLESIIVAATIGGIKGANGKTLKEQRDAVLICRRVVELNARLPLPQLVAFKASPGWQQRLTELRLGSVAAIVDSLAAFRCCDPEREVAIAEPYEDTKPVFLASEPVAIEAALREASMAETEPIDPETAPYSAAGFSDFRKSTPAPGTSLRPNYFAKRKDGSKWLIHTNTGRATCFSDTPITDWKIEPRGPIHPVTKEVRK